MAVTGETKKVGDDIPEHEKKELDAITSKAVQEAEASEKYDIAEALQDTGHKTCVYPNGIVLGLKIDGIKGKRGVHVDIVHVLDWRKASFSGSLLAMQSAVLETLNRDLTSILRDVNLLEMRTSRSRRTTRGRIEFEMLKAHESHSGSQIHETRTVYVVTEDVRPSVDLSWLTNAARIVGMDQFALAKQSDTRSVLPEMQRRVKPEKWTHLEKSVNLGWISIILFAFGIVGFASSMYVLASGVGRLILPLAAMIGGSILGSITFMMSRREMNQFFELVEEETAGIRRIGDGERISQSVAENADKFKRLKDMSFVISPLMASVGGAIRISDMKGAVYSASSAIDEIARFSTREEEILSEDEGLSKFLGIFAALDPEYDEASMSLSYVALSSYASNPLLDEEVILHSTTLLNALGRIGVVQPEVKTSIDELINQQSMSKMFTNLEQELNKPDPEEDRVLGEISGAHVAAEQNEETNNEDMTTAASLDDLQMTIKGATKEEIDSMPVIVAETAEVSVEIEPTA
ncbi:MAG: hypothetical protein ACTSQZ_03615, partial [Candidatus Thorarchaeota archaeon]